MPECKRIILSGGPGTGKTSVIEEIMLRGYSCHLEISREIIQEELEKGSEILPWKDLAAFSKKVIDGRKTQYFKAKPGLNFYDRSIVDSVAYMYKDNMKPSQDWLDWLSENLYHSKIFITAPWKEIFENDYERRESWEQLLELHEYIVSTYQKFGYEVIIIPHLPVKKRADFVLENL